MVLSAEITGAATVAVASASSGIPARTATSSTRVPVLTAEGMGNVVVESVSVNLDIRVTTAKWFHGIRARVLTVGGMGTVLVGFASVLMRTTGIVTYFVIVDHNVISLHAVVVMWDVVLEEGALAIVGVARIMACVTRVAKFKWFILWTWFVLMVVCGKGQRSETLNKFIKSFPSATYWLVHGGGE
jgi:hypothetical protein